MGIVNHRYPLQFNLTFLTLSINWLTLSTFGYISNKYECKIYERHSNVMRIDKLVAPQMTIHINEYSSIVISMVMVRSYHSLKFKCNTTKTKQLIFVNCIMNFAVNWFSIVCQFHFKKKGNGRSSHHRSYET